MTRTARSAAAVAAVLVVFASLLTACSGDSGPDCRPTSQLVPRCGVLWGIATTPNTNEQLAKLDRAVGVKFGMTYRFHDLDDHIPSAAEKTLASEGRTLHISIDARIYEPPAHAVRWSAVAAGDYDHALAADARGIAALKTPVFLTFDHEADQPVKRASGIPPQFVAAWRHVHDLFRKNGATNAVWAWVVTGYPSSAYTAGRLWPGNQYVDWISWEAYNGSGCTGGRTELSRYQSFSASALYFYTWLKRNGARFGIDTTKPMMISESGSVVYQSDVSRTAHWYREIPSVLRAHPQIKAIGLWDRPGTGGCRYRFDQEPTVVSAVRFARTAKLGPHPS